MSKNIVIIVECTSSCVNYLEDAKNNGYYPIVLEKYVPYKKRKKARNNHDIYYQLFNVAFPKTIMAKKSYENTLKMVKKIKPTLIIPGSDEGVELAVRLSNDLDLYSNKISSLPAMIDKNKCQEALKKNKVRYIKGQIVKNVKDALDFFLKQNENEIVLKPTGELATASVGVSICHNLDEIKLSFKRIKELYKNKHIHVLAQQYIQGEEYTVNTYSNHRKHYLSSITKYHKLSDGKHAPIYDYEEFLNKDNKYYDILTSYAFKVLDALKIECGPCHLEIKIDQYGPVLIEANCRLIGGLMKSSYLNKVLGFKESEIAFKSYFSSFNNYVNYAGKLHANGIIKYIINKEDAFVLKENLLKYFSSLKSFDYLLSKGENTIYHKTIDLSTHGGIVFLVNKNKKQLDADLSFIIDMEQNHYYKLFKINK